MQLDGIEDELWAWLQEILKKGERVSIKMIAEKASNLSPSFCQKSYRSKYSSIRQSRLFPFVHESVVDGPPRPTKNKNNNQHEQYTMEKTFHARQWMIDEDKSPVLPPDIIEGNSYESVDEARHLYKKLQSINWKKRNKYVPGALYKNMFDECFVVLDHDVEGDFNIRIDYTPSRKERKNSKGVCTGLSLVPMAFTWVKVRSAYVKTNYLRALLAVDNQLDVNKGTVRQSRGDVGHMWQVGLKKRGLMTEETLKKYYKATESTFIVSDNVNIRSSTLPTMNYFMSSFFQSAFPNEFMEIHEGNKGIQIEKAVGGDGSLHTFSISCDLGNASHVDSGDESVGISTWVENKPGKAKNWYFILPNTTLLDDPTKAIVIKLSHGLTIAWDGRVIHHCTSITDTGEENHVYGNFATTSKVRALG